MTRRKSLRTILEEQEKERESQQATTTQDGQAEQIADQAPAPTFPDERQTISAEQPAIPQGGNTVENRKAVKKSDTVKITIYPTKEQADKLYDLMEAFRKRTGVKINQQDMIRRLIDLADPSTVLP
jgi:hypothetical protein